MAKCRRWKTCKKKNTINGMCVIKESSFLQPYPCFLRPIITPKPPKKKKDRVIRAWAYWSYGQMEIQRHNCIQPSCPVTITIKSKDWEKIKG